MRRSSRSYRALCVVVGRCRWHFPACPRCMRWQLCGSFRLIPAVSAQKGLSYGFGAVRAKTICFHWVFETARRVPLDLCFKNSRRVDSVQGLSNPSSWRLRSDEANSKTPLIKLPSPSPPRRRRGGGGSVLLIGGVYQQGFEATTSAGNRCEQ